MAPFFTTTDKLDRFEGLGRNSLIATARSKYPPAEPEALGFEPLKAASGAFVAHANFPLGLARTTDCAQHSHPSAAIRAIFTVSMHLCQCPTFKNRKPGHTPGNVKLLLPPRQSRGFSFSE